MKMRERKFKNDAEIKRFVRWKLGKIKIADTQGYDYLARKVGLVDKIASLAEDGKVAVVYNERDCDMVQSNGNVEILPASAVAFIRWLDKKLEWAEGPVNWELYSPSETVGIEQTTRDLVMEAFEDGHPHVVYA
jgi:hypothetical protein